MKNLRFKTDINCGACVRSVTGFLNDVPEITRWEVATDHPDKILTVAGDQVTAERVVAAVEEAGFSAEPLPSSER